MIDEYILTDTVASRWIENWNRRDIDGLVAMYDDVLQCRSPFIRELTGKQDGLIDNKADLKRYFENILENYYADMHMLHGSVSTGINCVTFSYTCMDGYIADASLTLNDEGHITVSNFTYRRQGVFADRLKRIPKSFIREILKVTTQPDIISFAGGLPNPEYFPIEAIREASSKVLAANGAQVLQYAVTEGYAPLREYIAERYMQRFGMHVDPADVLITNGSQQGLDLIGKVMLNPGDGVVMEKPSYLGAIQALSAYDPRFVTVPLRDDGVDTALLEETCMSRNVKLMYSIPNFQNPTGISYSPEVRKRTADIISCYQMFLVEDDPYGEIRFIGEDQPPIRSLVPEQTMLLGSFSKTIAPGLRMGWIVAPQYITEKLVVAKQAADLHSNFLSQRVIYQYLQDNNVEEHIALIKQAYKRQRDYMVAMIEQHFPPSIHVTKPEGGMFLWATLPEGVDAKAVFDIAIREKVAFVPGAPFHLQGEGGNTMRLNFSNSSEEAIELGIQRLGAILWRVLEMD